MKVQKLTTGFLKITLGLAVASITFMGCEKNNEEVVIPPTPAAVRPDIVFYGLTDDNRILKYNAKTAESSSGVLTVTGLQFGERILSIDFRPATGQLYGLGSTSRLYIINLNSGNATAVNTAQFTPNVVGALANIDFNPTVDRVRLVTNAGQNLRLNPETGLSAATDLAINGGSSPVITSIAYTNNISGASTTDLYDIDLTSKKLYKQSPPNDGKLVEVGSLNVDFSGKGGFDINADNTTALATFTVGSTDKLYTVNLTNGATTYLADLKVQLVDIAIPTQAVAYAISASGMFQTFNPTTTTAPVTKSITGLAAGESILGIDFRPVNGQLYGIAATTAGAAKLYTFNLSNGTATGIGAGFSIAAGVTAAGFDFNPTVDRIRFVTNTGQNLRLNPNDGTIAATDGNLNPGSPIITGAAYTNNFAGTTSSSLFVLDGTTLYNQIPPNNGTLVSVGPLGVTNGTQNGFDIGGTSNSAFAIFTVGTASKIYSINLTNGAATAGVDFPNAVSALAVGLGF